MTKLKNIKRIDNDKNSTYAWVVQVQRNYCITWKMFSDGIYGGKRKSLAAAKEFKEQVLADVPSYEYHHHLRTIVRRNNTSGIPGVGRYESINNPNTGHRMVFWLAYWDDENGTRRSRKFSVLKYGDLKAKKLAVAERKRRLKEVCTIKCQ